MRIVSLQSAALQAGCAEEREEITRYHRAVDAFGFIGLVIGPLVFSLLMSIIDIYKRSFGLPRSPSKVA